MTSPSLRSARQPSNPCRLRPVAIAAAALSLFLGGCGGSSSDGPATTDGPSSIVTSERSLVDTTRPTPANHSYPGAPDRTLATRLWYRETPPRHAAACREGVCGLVVVAHGFGGFTGRFDRFARGLADAGWIVAAPTFPLTNQNAPGGLAINDFVEQPADLSFAITELLAANADEADELAGRIDPGFIGVVGHSLGGATVVAASRVGGYSDSRISAVVGVAPAVTVIPAILHVQPSPSGPPLLVVQRTKDQAISYDSSLAFYETLDPVRAFVGLTGADHITPIESDPYPGTFIPETTEATLGFFAAIKTGDGAPLEQALDALADAGHVVEVELAQ